MSFVLACDTPILLDTHALPVQNAADVLRRDLRRCLKETGGQQALALARDASLPEEDYRLCVGDGTATLRYGGDLGAVYGLYAISERFLGIAPLADWNGLPPPVSPRQEIPAGTYESPKRAVRLRGWFVNDEILLDGWAGASGDRLGMWRRIFETLLRLGGNMVLPGTDRKDDGEELAQMASDMGLWLTQHHAELLGARMFARAYPGVRPSYTEHPELFEALWEESARRLAGRRVVWAVGYRAQGDQAFWTLEKGFDTPSQRGGMISRVIARQMEIVRAHDPNALFCTNIYGEMAGLYRSGDLRVPAEVVKVWADNGYGRMVNRRDGNLNPRVSSMPQGEPGLNGVYDHVSFYDLQAANHLTMSPNDPRMLAGELQKALACGANAYWLINVGSIKPHLYLIDLMARLWNDGLADVEAHARQYAQTYYGSDAVGPLLLEYSRHTLPYGPNADDHAGDQYYHFVLRHIARALMAGQTREAVEALRWAADDASFSRQVFRIRRICEAGMSGWEPYVRRLEKMAGELDKRAGELLEDSLLLQARLHRDGCRALRDVCRAAERLRDGEPVDAFLLVHRALERCRDSVCALEAAQRNGFEGYYANDCFTNVRLSARVLEALRAWIRACHDEQWYTWERRYLYAPGDREVRCRSHRTNQLTDDALAQGLMAVTPPDE